MLDSRALNPTMAIQKTDRQQSRFLTKRSRCFGEQRSQSLLAVDGTVIETPRKKGICQPVFLASLFLCITRRCCPDSGEVHTHPLPSHVIILFGNTTCRQIIISKYMNIIERVLVSFCCCDKHPNPKFVRGGRIYLAHSSRSWSIIVEKQRQDVKQLSHHTGAERKESVHDAFMLQLMLGSLSSVQFREQPIKWCHPHSGWTFLDPFTRKTTPHRHAHTPTGPRQVFK